LLAEISYPINCQLSSEKIANVSIILKERTSKSLKGYFYRNNIEIGNIETSKPSNQLPATWKFQINNRSYSGEILLFKNNLLWNQSKTSIRSEDLNRVIFSGLTSVINSNTNDFALIESSKGFFKIGKGCYGGRIRKL